MGKKGRDADELEDDELEDELEEEGGGNKKRRNPFVDDAADEDDEEEDEDDGAKKRKKKRSGASTFIDDIADVDDDEEEEEDDDDEGDLIDDRDLEDFPNQPSAQQHASFRQINREREEKSAEEIARFFEERYQRMEEGAYEDSAVLTQAGAVGQQAMQPTLNDPKLWLIHCRPGHEREAVTQLLQKYYVMHGNRTPLLIKSAVTLDHLKGYIYVEADKEAHVRDAIKGLRTIFVSKGVKLVPLDQMVDAITVNRKAKASIARDMWVRVRNGLYKDDLAKVMEVDHAAQKATIRLVPRVDLQAIADRAQDEEARKRNPFNRGPVRPPSRPFNADEARQLGLLINRVPGLDGTVYLQLGSHRFINGYVERDIAFKGLIVIEGMPPLEELQRYNACGAAADEASRGLAQGGTGDLSSLVSALPNGGAIPKTHFLKGDPVSIVTGELKGIEAIVDSVRDDGKVMVRPTVEGFTDVVDFDNEDLRKVFKVGDHVRVVTGPYSGEIGIVLQVVPDNDQCIIISDTTRQEIKAFGRDMTTTDVSNTGVDVLGEYQLHDLVQLDQNTAGVIINIQRDAARVLTSASNPEQADVRVVKATDIQRKLKARNLLTSDMNNNQVRANDYVTFQTARGSASRTHQAGGTVEYVWRGTLFLKGKEFGDTGGFLCVRANKCKVRGASSNPGVDLARQVAGMAPRSSPRETPGGSSQGGRAAFQYMPMSPSQYAQANNNRGGPGGGPPGPGGMGGFKPPPPRPGGGMGGGFSGASHRANTMNTMVGKTVCVVGGQYNGYKGRVKTESATHVQLELDAIAGRTVTVAKGLLRDESAMAGSRGPRGPMPRAHPGGGYEGGYSGSVGSAYGSRTPLHPSQTPLHPSMTPAHYSMAMTPSHAPYTPAHAPTPSDDNAYMLGSHNDDRHYPTARTPGMAAYTPNAFTPAAAPTPSMHPDGHSAPTPALDGGPDGDDDGPPLMADTPGLAPTPNLPAPVGAPTPYLTAPTPAITPGDLHAPTPGMHMDGLTGATPSLAPTPHTDHMHMYTPNIAATPQLPGSTPGPTAAVMEAPRNYSNWVGLVVQIAGAGDPLSWPQAEVVGVEPDGRLRVVRGAFSTVGNDGPGDFFAAAGVQQELLQGAQLRLFRPGKKDRVKVLNAEAHAHMHINGIGTIVGVDADQECIVRMETQPWVPGAEMCIVPVACLGKVARQQQPAQ